MPPVNRYGRPISSGEAWTVQRQKDWRHKRWDPKNDIGGYITTEAGNHYYKWGRILTRAYPVLRELQTEGVGRIGKHWIIGGWLYDEWGQNEKTAMAILAPEGDPFVDFRPPPKKILGFTIDEWMGSIAGGADAEVIVGETIGAKVGLRVATLAEVRLSLSAGVKSAKIAPEDATYATRRFAVEQQKQLQEVHNAIMQDEALGVSKAEADLLRVEQELDANARFWEGEAGGALSRSPKGRRLAREYADDARAAARAARDRRAEEYNKAHAAGVQNMEARGDNMLRRLNAELESIEKMGGTAAQKFERYEHTIERFENEVREFDKSPASSAAEARARINRSTKTKNRINKAKQTRDEYRAGLIQEMGKTKEMYRKAEKGFEDLAADYFRKSAEAQTKGDTATADSYAQMADDAINNAAKYQKMADDLEGPGGSLMEGDTVRSPEEIQKELDDLYAKFEAREAEALGESGAGGSTAKTRAGGVGGATIDAKRVFIPVVGEAGSLEPPRELAEDVEDVEDEEDHTRISKNEIMTALHLSDVVESERRQLTIASDVKTVEAEGARAIISTLNNGEQWVTFSGIYRGDDYPDEITKAPELGAILSYMLGEQDAQPEGTQTFGTSLFGAIVERLTGFNMSKVLTPLHAHVVDLHTALNLPEGSPIDVQGVAQIGICRLLSTIYDDILQHIRPDAAVKLCGFGAGGALASLFALKYLLESGEKVARVYSIGAPRCFELFGTFLTDNIDIVSILNKSDPLALGYGAVMGHKGRKIHITPDALEFLPANEYPEQTPTPHAAFLDMVQKQRTEGAPRRLQVTAIAFNALRAAGWSVGEALAGAVAAEVTSTAAPLAVGEEVKRTESWIEKHEHTNVVDLEDIAETERIPRPEDITRATYQSVGDALASGSLDLAAVHSPKAYADALAKMSDTVHIPFGSGVQKPWADLVQYLQDPEEVGGVGWTEGIDQYLAQFGKPGDAQQFDIAAIPSNQKRATITALRPAGFVLYETKQAPNILNNFVLY